METGLIEAINSKADEGVSIRDMPVESARIETKTSFPKLVSCNLFRYLSILDPASQTWVIQL